MSARNIAAAGILLLEAAFAGCVADAQNGAPPQWKPIGNRKARVVHWGVIHNHSRGKWDAVRLLKDDYELVGWVDDRASTAMRMSEPKIDVYTNYPCFTPQQVFDEVKPDLIVVETANSDLVEVSTEIARHGIPMHMDKPLGTDQEGYRRMSAICEARGVPLQIGFREGINRLSFKAPQDRYAGQLRELARILRGEIPNPPGLYLHDLKVHKVSLDACNLKTEDVK